MREEATESGWLDALVHNAGLVVFASLEETGVPDATNNDATTSPSGRNLTAVMNDPG